MKYYFFILLIATSCKPSYEEPHISLSEYQIEDGFDLQLVASEPLITAPVAIDFDAKGRIWVAEMPGFMRNIEGDGENEPTGSIKILLDRDQDGVMDGSKIFLDSLVLPRALALVYDGLLYAEPPYLWFVEIKDDKPGKRTLVDSLYAPVGNPEHQANGLKLNIDNWIYSAKSNYRYQLKDGKWIKQNTNFRGQWGISQDDYGRLYYNDNSTLLRADFLLPNRLTRNPYYVPKFGVHQALGKGQRVYPLQPSYVNRGYSKGVLDKDSLLIDVTAACGPLVYRGGAFSANYDQNVFVCLPEANLIKRNVLSFHDDHSESKATLKTKEFLASYDRGFRPVSLSNGPEGSMYVVDMHIGMLQHYAFLSPYLKKLSKQKQFDTLIDLGRILKISNQKSIKKDFLDFDRLSAKQLVKLLDDKNGWVRDHAQQFIIFNKVKQAIAGLNTLVQEVGSPIAQLHALYTLKGLGVLSFDTLISVARTSSPQVTASAIVLLEDHVSSEKSVQVRQLFAELMQQNNVTIDLYLSTTVGTWASTSQKDFFPVIQTLSEKYRDRELFNEAILSGIGGIKDTSMQTLKENVVNTNESLLQAFGAIEKRKKMNRPNNIYLEASGREDARTVGAKLFRQICVACHASDGSGIEGLAPPLINSEYMTKPHERLALIILHGLEGPVHVNGTLYELGHIMPGLLNNKKLTDEDIADIIAYVTSAFSDSPKRLESSKIKELRSERSASGMEYTEAELIEHYN
ncbi:MAG: c-type cytochrome [Flavobacteriaceae bacterium]